MLTAQCRSNRANKLQHQPIRNTHTLYIFYNYSWAIEKDMIENLMKTGREV